MAHDARNGLATIVLRAQMLARSLRRGDHVEAERIAHGLSEIERVAKRTARRIEEIEAGLRARHEADAGSDAITEQSDHGGDGGP
jgi:hypothetical protein